MYIIDTHALLWYLRNSDELSETAQKIIDNEDTIFVSIASLCEIAIKPQFRQIGVRVFDFADKSVSFR